MVKPFYVKTNDRKEVEFIYDKSMEAGAYSRDTPEMYYFIGDVIGFGVDGDNDTVVVHKDNLLSIDLHNDLIDISEVEEFLGGE